jgi:hypothetical protein
MVKALFTSDLLWADIVARTHLWGYLFYMFSDRYRFLKIMISLVFLLGLGAVYTDFALSRPEGYRAALADPVNHDGADMLFPLWSVTHIRDANMYTIAGTLRDVPVQGSTEGLDVGDSVTVVGHFRAEDRAVVATDRIDHPLRPWKGGFSLLAILFGLVAAPRFFGWREGRVVIRG